MVTNAITVKLKVVGPIYSGPSYTFGNNVADVVADVAVSSLRICVGALISNRFAYTNCTFSTMESILWFVLVLLVVGSLMFFWLVRLTHL